eukprot:UN00251
MARTYNIVHMQPGWRQIKYDKVNTRFGVLVCMAALGYRGYVDYLNYERKTYNDKKDAEIFKWKRDNNLLTEGYVNHYAQALNRK